MSQISLCFFFLKINDFHNMIPALVIQVSNLDKVNNKFYLSEYNDLFILSKV